MPLDLKSLLDEATCGLDGVIALRRAIHAEPEVGTDLPQTQRKVLDALAGLDLQVSLGRRLSSVIATLRGAAPGPTVLLRGDMDALALREQSGAEFASRYDNTMHACGHDAHTAMLVGAARLLSAHRDRLAGAVTFFFQPGEEGRHGARLAMEEGLLGPPLSPGHAFALHIAPDLPAGSVATRAGAIMAEATTIRFTVKGRGAHAARPHHSIDPVPAACQAVAALQSLIARETDPADPAVLSVTGLRTSSMLTNVIPDQVDGVATLRTFGDGDGARLASRAVEVITATAAAMRASADVEVISIYPVTRNDPGDSRVALDVARRLVGPGNTTEMSAPVAGSEDFGYILQEIPGALAFLGVGREREEPMELHSPRLRIDERAMAVGVAMHAAVAMELLAQ